MKKEEAYNKGDAYEIKIFQILSDRGIISDGTKRGRASNYSDAIFCHKNREFNLEIKKDLLADYGQKMLHWSKSDMKWYWAVDDVVTKFYSDLGILNYLQDKNIIPIKDNKNDQDITYEDKKIDQKLFENKCLISPEALCLFYANKDCHYIQIGDGYGFYHLDDDVANLGTPKFDGVLKIRFRAKTIHSNPVYRYGFYAVIKIEKKPTKSPYNLEPFKGQKFPPISND